MYTRVFVVTQFRHFKWTILKFGHVRGRLLTAISFKRCVTVPSKFPATAWITRLCTLLETVKCLHWESSPTPTSQLWHSV